MEVETKQGLLSDLNNNKALFGSRGTTSGNRSDQDCPFNLYVADLTGNHSGAEKTQTNEP